MKNKFSPIFWCISLIFALQFVSGPSIHASSIRSRNNIRQESYVDTFPTPTGIENLLFYIQRDPNTNTIVYTLNLDEHGQINHSSPIHPFWIRYPEGGAKKELNFIQRKFAYGINSKKLGTDQFDIRSAVD